MMANRFAPLDAHGVLQLSGADARSLLQGLVTSDMGRVSEKSAVYAALLTPQGKFLHDFMIAETGGAFLLDGLAARLGDLARRLTLYRLRAQVDITDRSADFRVYALFGEGVLERLGLEDAPGAARSFAGGVCFTDPRLAAAGARAILPRGAEAELEAAGLTPAPAEEYEKHRLSLNLAEGGIDILPEKNFLLECNFEELHGVDFDKGCYVGQEVTARTKHRSTVRKRLLPVRLEGPPPPFGTAIMAGRKEVGELRSAAGGRAIALIRLERLAEAEAEGTALTAGEAVLALEMPDWLDL